MCVCFSSYSFKNRDFGHRSSKEQGWKQFSGASHLLRYILCPQIVNLCPNPLLCTKAESRTPTPLHSLFASGLLVNIQRVFTASPDNIHSSFSFMAFNLFSLLEVEQILCCFSHQGHRTIDLHSLPLLCWKNTHLASFRFLFSRLNKPNCFTFSSHVVFTSSSHFHCYSPEVFQYLWTLYLYCAFSATAEIHQLTEVCGFSVIQRKEQKKAYRPPGNSEA